MRANFDRIFKEEGVDNVVWVMDFSWNIRDHPDLAVDLWPDVDNVTWLFWNMFQFGAESTSVGDCVGGFKNIYQNMTDRMDKVPRWKDIPWGLGAWGIIDFQKNEQDKIDCIMGVKEIQESGDYPKLRASIYFNSLTSRIAKD